MIKRLLATVLLAASPAFAEHYAIINAKAVTQTGEGTIENATIVINDDVIVSIGVGVDVPSDAVVIDAKGNYVTPGFIGTAVNWGIVEVSAEDSTNEMYFDDSGAATHMAYALNPDSTRLQLARRWGFTRAILNPGYGNGLFNGQAALFRTDGDRPLEERAVAQFVNMNDYAVEMSGGSRAELWHDFRQAMEEAKHYARNKSSAFEDSANYSMSIASLEALQPVLTGEHVLVFDIDRQRDILIALHYVEKYNLRAAIRGGAEAWRVARDLAVADVAVILDPLANLPGSFSTMGARLDNAALLDQEGVEILFYSSEPYSGQTITQAAGVAVANGMNWYSAIDALTTNVHDVFGGVYRADLREGSQADIVVWSGDPLEVTSAPTFVMINGGVVDLEATRANRLEQRYLNLDSDKPFGYVK